MADYTKGIKIKTIQGKFGEFMKVGINIDDFKLNPINERGYVNFKITKSRNGDWYAVNDETPVNNTNCSDDTNNPNQNNDEVVGDIEIPF